MSENNKSMAMARAMSGELNSIIRERTGIDTRGLMDPLPAYLVDKAIKRCKAKGRTHALAVLEEAQRRMVIDQSRGITMSLNEDISRLGLMTGNKEMKNRSVAEIFGD